MKISRRDFLELTRGIAISSLLGASSSQTQENHKPPESDNFTEINNVALIDFLPENLSDELITDLANQMDGQEPSYEWRLKLKAAANLQLESDELMQLFITNYREHGLYTISRQNVLLEKFKRKTKPIVVDLFESIDEVKSIFDEYGNKGFSIYFSADPIIKKLRNIDQDIIGFASEFGQIDIIFNKYRLEALDDEKANEILSWQNIVEGSVDNNPKNSTERYFTPVPKFESVRFEYINGMPKAIFTMPNEYTDLVHDKKGLNGYSLRKVTEEKPIEIIVDPLDYEAFEDDRDIYYGDMLARHTFLVLNKVAKFRDNVDLYGNNFLPESFNVKPAYSQFNKSGLTELSKMAVAFPEKLFICAGGNYGEDLRHKKEFDLNNVLFIARAERINKKGGFGGGLKSPSIMDSVKGADVYVDANEIGYGSTSTIGIVTAFANVLSEKGYSPKEIKRLIKANTQTIHRGILDVDPSLEYPILDIKRFYYKCRYIY